MVNIKILKEQLIIIKRKLKISIKNIFLWFEKKQLLNENEQLVEKSKLYSNIIR
jgi:hypothetical protein